jgi:hypothetical protein
MRLIPRQMQRHSSKPPLISISQAEITADLQYPAPRRQEDAPTVRALRPR